MGKSKSFVKLDRKLMENWAFRSAGSFARDLYACMLNSLYNENNGSINKSSRRAAFGPSDAKVFGIAKTTFYRAVNRLIDLCIIEELEPGGHGRRAVYDLEAWKYKLAIDWDA